MMWLKSNVTYKKTLLIDHFHHHNLTSLYTGEGFESTSKILIGNQCHVTLCIVSLSTLFK